MKTNQRQQAGYPWFRQFDGWWYCTIGGERFKLAKGEENKEAALAEWHRLWAMGTAKNKQDTNPCWVIFEHYLDHIQRNHPACYKNYEDTSQSFKDRWDGLQVGELTVRHVNEWLDSHPGWGSSMRSLAVAVLYAALNWASKPERGLVGKNPIKGMTPPSRPEAKRQSSAQTTSANSTTW
jgi:hypothetical protein